MAETNDETYQWDDVTCVPYDFIEGEEDNEESQRHKDISNFFNIDPDKDFMQTITGNIGFQAIIAIIIFLIVYLLGTFLYRDIPNRIIKSNLDNTVRVGGMKNKKK
tara:strand:+ start:8675 stop:8992 length:318 start_codon:yes stop_codon:yes gene_type:complete